MSAIFQIKISSKVWHPSLNKDSLSINIVTEFKSMELEDTNAMVLDAFGEYLEKVKGLEPKSVRKHQDRVNTFIQTYLQ